MSANRRGQIGECIELLHLTRARDRQQTGDGELAGLAAIAEHDLAPLYGRAQRTFRAVIGRLDALVMNEDEELLMVREQRGRQIAGVVVPAVKMPFAQAKNFRWSGNTC